MLIRTHMKPDWINVFRLIIMNTSLLVNIHKLYIISFYVITISEEYCNMVFKIIYELLNCSRWAVKNYLFDFIDIMTSKYAFSSVNHRLSLRKKIYRQVWFIAYTWVRITKGSHIRIQHLINIQWSSFCDKRYLWIFVLFIFMLNIYM